MSDRIELDHKQSRIIQAWMNYGAQDDYGRFISLWVAFNALCYAKYSSQACRPRADYIPKRGAAMPRIGQQPLQGTMSVEPDRINLVLSEPLKATIKIRERYTEDLIYQQFADEYAGAYSEWLHAPEFGSAVALLREALSKGSRTYVVNMAKAAQYDPEGDYQSMKRANVIVPWERVEDLDELKGVLYQVRCNVFHGEKAPGVLNDDRIVKSATPVLRFICQQLAPPEGPAEPNQG